MKKLIIPLIAVAFLFTGCIYLCAHKTEIMDGIKAVMDGAQASVNEAQKVIDDIHAQYPGLPIPADVQKALDTAKDALAKAQAVYLQAQIALQAVCPNQAMLDTLNAQLVDAKLLVGKAQVQRKALIK